MADKFANDENEVALIRSISAGSMHLRPLAWIISGTLLETGP